MDTTDGDGKSGTVVAKRSRTKTVVAKQDTGVEASTSHAPTKKQADFNDLSQAEMVGMIVATVEAAEAAGLTVVKMVASHGNNSGILIFLPSFKIANGAIVATTSEAQ